MGSVTPSKPPPLGDDQSKLSISKDTIKEEEILTSQGRSLLGKLDSLLSWIGKIITEQAQYDRVNKDPIPETTSHHQITVEKSIEDVIENAERISEELSIMKLNFLNKALSNDAVAFIAKSIDPMIEHARKLIQELKKSDDSPKVKNPHVLAKAVETVELYRTFKDEAKLTRKIIDEGLDFTKSAVDRDIQHLLVYHHQQIEDFIADPSLKQMLEIQLRDHLRPILERLQDMALLVPDFIDIPEFFTWKKSIDEERESLLNLAYLTVESIMARFGRADIRVHGSEGAEEVVSQNVFEPVLAHTIEEASGWLTMLVELESKLHILLNEIQQVENHDGESLHLKENVLRDIRRQTESLGDIIYSNSVLQNNLHDLLKMIDTTEHILRMKQHENFFGES